MGVVEVLQQMGGKLDILVAPFRSSVSPQESGFTAEWVYGRDVGGVWSKTA
jgi:hypothetical protein